jgi:beta-mannosidase
MHHPSIVIWSANNENEAALGWFKEVYTNRDRYVVDYNELYINVIRPAILEQDTTRPFLPSSPSNGPLCEDPYTLLWGNPGDFRWGDVHYYNYDGTSPLYKDRPI